MSRVVFGILLGLLGPLGCAHVTTNKECTEIVVTRMGGSQVDQVEYSFMVLASSGLCAKLENDPYKVIEAIKESDNK